MKKAKADRILWDVGYWRWFKRKKRNVRKWMSVAMLNSRKLARDVKYNRTTMAPAGVSLFIRRFEGFYIGDGE